jgi:hypothetical protein
MKSAGSSARPRRSEEIMARRIGSVCLVPVAGPGDVAAGAAPDWPQHRGPRRDLETTCVSTAFDACSGPGTQGLVLPSRAERHFGTRYLVHETRSVESDPEFDAAVFRLGAPDPAPAAEGS